ncbi:alcohol dehydrogenase [Teratosphaeria nubilosa]|uniref:Alcohol dehydrogenase n=1 Tax=Teratosphaeria nubilosa TaxID=161662 RepID=A0A6G1LHE8_9PEZI|nr:alcohol dehydrogenase [Teratosphaeria nubilosa]
MAAPETAVALVARGPASSGQWNLERVTLRPCRDDELVVRIVACGICLADVHFGDVPEEEAQGNPLIYYPRVLGHEGSGYVEKIGKNVTCAKPGDPVILSYLSCGSCYTCSDDHPAYCKDLMDLNFIGNASFDVEGAATSPIGGQFFGQSSFSSRTLVKERTVVNLKGLIEDEEELKLLAPLGCGVQTGSGTMIRIGGAKKGDSVVVLGVGSVGLSAIMGAKLQECAIIITIDRVQSRLDLARELGATHVINTSDQSINLVQRVMEITDGQGVHIALDTTGVQSLARQTFDMVRNRGRILQNGLARPGDNWDVPMADLMNTGKQILGAVQGDAIPQDYIPQMIKWYHEGRLPVEKLVKQYKASDFQRALDDMRAGTTVKPILIFPEGSTPLEPPRSQL